MYITLPSLSPSSRLAIIGLPYSSPSYLCSPLPLSFCPSLFFPSHFFPSLPLSSLPFWLTSYSPVFTHLPFLFRPFTSHLLQPIPSSFRPSFPLFLFPSHPFNVLLILSLSFPFTSLYSLPWPSFSIYFPSFHSPSSFPSCSLPFLPFLFLCVWIPLLSVHRLYPYCISW